MRTLTLALFAIVVAAAPIAAIAEPPPQATTLVAVPVQEPAMPLLDAVVVTQADTSSNVASAQATIDADSATRDSGRGKTFWAIAAFVVLVGGVFLYRYLTREPEPYEATERSAPPDPGERRPKNR